MSFLKQPAPPITLTQVIKESLEGKRPARGYTHIHASDLTKEGFCPRRICLIKDHQKKVKDEFLAAALAITFEVGNLTAQTLCENWAGAKAVGHWKCSCCGKIITFSRKPEKKHECSPYSRWEYKEVNFVHVETKASGNVDLLVDLGGPKLSLFELKIMSPNEFDKLVNPLAEHRVRTNLYLDIIKGSASPWASAIDTTRASILYISRGHGKKTESLGILPFKEFQIDYKDGSSDAYLGRARAITMYEEGKAELPARVCPNCFGGAAKYCEVVNECFNGAIHD